jgi:outer membrane protein
MGILPHFAGQAADHYNRNYLQMKLKIVFSLILLSWGFTSVAQETMTLFQAIQTGLENNYSIIIVKNNANIAKNNNTIGNAGFLPDVGISAAQNNTVANTHQKKYDGTTNNISNAKNSTLNAGAQLTWTLFDGFSMFITKNMLGVLEDMGETQARAAIDSALSTIILNYYGIVQQQKMIQVLTDAVNLSMERKKIAEAKISLGSGSHLDLLQSTVDLNADSTNLIRALSDVLSTKADLNRLLARPPETPFEVTDTINLSFRITYDSLLAKAKDQNTDLLLARNNMDLSLLALKDTRSQRYPRLNFQAGYNYSRLNSQTGFLEYNRSYGPSYGLTATYTIFNGFNVNRSIRNAKISLNSSETQVKETDLDVNTNLFKLYLDYISNMQVVKLQLQNQ